MSTFESERASLYGKPGDDRILFVRNSRSAPEPQPSAVDLLTQVIDRLGEIEDRLFAIEAGQASAAVRLDSIEYNAGIAEDVRILVRDDVIPYVQYAAKCANNIEDVVIEIADAVAPIDTEDGADVVPLTNLADNADTTEEN